jgi:glutathione S-transferase
VKLYDAARCPYCARVRIVLAEKGIDYDTVEIDLGNRPGWLYGKNPLGRVPVLEEDALVLPESVVIMEYLEETTPEPQLLPQAARDRAYARLWIETFDARLGDAYYALRRGRDDGSALREALGRLDAHLAGSAWLAGSAFGLADVAYAPWVLRARDSLGVALDGLDPLEAWLTRLTSRASVAREVEVVASL